MGFSFRFSSYFKAADSKILPLSRQSCFALSDFKVADSKILPLSRQSCFALSDFLVVRSEENFYNLLCRLLRRTFASQIYDNSHYKKALDRIYFCQGRINFPRCHLASRQYACTFRILTYPRQLTYVSRHRILRYFLSLCPPWSI